MKRWLSRELLRQTGVLDRGLGCFFIYPTIITVATTDSASSAPGWPARKYAAGDCIELPDSLQGAAIVSAEPGLGPRECNGPWEA